MRPVAVATCDLDTALIAGRTPYKGPFAFGHECVAEVVEVGDSVSGHVPGDLVSVAFQIFCGQCPACREGRSASCTETPPMAMLRPADRRRVGRFSLGPGARPLCRADDGDLARRGRAGGGGQRQRQHLRRLAHGGPAAGRAPGLAVLVCAGAGSIDLYAAAIAAALGPSGSTTSAGARARRTWPGSWGRTWSRATSRAPRPLPDHGRCQRQPRRPRLRPALDRARRRLHQRRHLLRAGDAGAAAGDVHEGHHLPHRSRPRRPGDARGARPDRRRQARSEPGHPRVSSIGTMRRGRSPSISRSSSSAR